MICVYIYQINFCFYTDMFYNFHQHYILPILPNNLFKADTPKISISDSAEQTVN